MTINNINIIDLFGLLQSWDWCPQNWSKLKSLYGKNSISSLFLTRMLFFFATCIRIANADENEKYSIFNKTIINIQLELRLLHAIKVHKKQHILCWAFAMTVFFFWTLCIIKSTIVIQLDFKCKGVKWNREGKKKRMSNIGYSMKQHTQS